MTSIPYMPAPMPPGVISPSSHVEQRDEAGDRLDAVVPGVDRAGAGAGRDGHEQAADAPRRSGPPCPPCCRAPPGRRRPGTAGCRRTRRASRTTAPTSRIDRHGAEDRPALALVAGVPPERVGQRERDDSRIANDLEPVRQRRRALERVGRVGVEEPAAVVAQLLDPLLGGDRAEGDGLLRALEGRHDVGRVPGLGHALPDEDERADDRDRQQDVQDAAGQVDPVVADRLRAAAGQAADQRDRDREAGRGRGEVADREHARPGSGRSRRSRPSSSASWCWSRS